MMKKKIAGIVLLVSGVAVCLFAGFKILTINREYRASQTLYSEQQKKYVVSEPESGGTVENALENITVDFEGLKKDNPDICGWIHIPAISVSYPILQGESNDTYLRHLPDGRYNTAGSIFVDERCKNDFTSPVTIIYGHNMNNGTMFGKLKKFLNTSFLKENADFEIYTPEGIAAARILGCFETKSSSSIYDLPDENSIYAYLRLLSEESKMDLGSVDAEKDNLLLLSTCSRSFESARTVLIAAIEKV